MATVAWLAPVPDPGRGAPRARPVAAVGRLCYGSGMIPRTPEECDALFAHHMNADDLDALVGLYEPGATLIPAPGETAVGQAAIREALAGLVAARTRITMHVVRVLRAGDDLAALYNDWRATLIGPDGQQLEVAGKAIEVVRRQPDGTWRFAIDDPYARG